MMQKINSMTISWMLVLHLVMELFINYLMLYLLLKSALKNIRLILKAGNLLFMRPPGSLFTIILTP